MACLFLTRFLIYRWFTQRDMVRLVTGQMQYIIQKAKAYQSADCMLRLLPWNMSLIEGQWRDTETSNDYTDWFVIIYWFISDYSTFHDSVRVTVSVHVSTVIWTASVSSHWLTVCKLQTCFCLLSWCWIHGCLLSWKLHEPRTCHAAGGFAEDPAVEVHNLLTWKSSSCPVKRHYLSSFIHWVHDSQIFTCRYSNFK